MTDKIILPPGYADEISDAMESGGGIRLPFTAPTIWVVNGKMDLKPLGGVSYFGGWNSSQEEVNAYVEETSTNLPSYFKPVERVARDGTALQLYETRYLFIAPIAFRQSWVNTSTKQRYPEWTDGARHHIQVLAYMLDHVVTKQEKQEINTYPGIGPVVVSAKGYQARYVRDAISAWEKFTAPIRRQIAQGVPSYFFALCLGTFGKEPVYKEVGGGKGKSIITPVGPYMPESLTGDQLRKLYVGETVAALMVDYKRQAVDWISAWKGSVGQDSIPSAAYDETDDMPPQPDDLPF